MVRLITLRLVVVIVVVSVSLLLRPIAGHAQSVDAVLMGTVSDETGATLPGAMVMATTDDIPDEFDFDLEEECDDFDADDGWDDDDGWVDDWGAESPRAARIPAGRRVRAAGGSEESN